MLKAFLANKEEYYKVLVSFTALEEGIDYPSIRLVVYINYIHSFIGYLQSSSRAGRDNRESTSIFFYLQDNCANLDSSSALDIDKSYIQRFILESVYKRQVIEQYLDNTLVEQCPSSVSKCCLCLERLNVQNATISTILESNKGVQVSRNSLITLCTILEELCLPCLLLESLEASWLHKFLGCPKYYKPLHTEFNSIRTKNSFVASLLKEDSCCFRCFLPSFVCSTLKKQGAKCCNLFIVYIFFSACLSYYKELKLKAVLRV